MYSTLDKTIQVGLYLNSIKNGNISDKKISHMVNSQNKLMLTLRPEKKGGKRVRQRPFRAKNLRYGTKYLHLNLLRCRICLKPATKIVL